jgi:hypothetical protein
VGGTVGVWVSNTGTSAPANLAIVGSGVQATGGPIFLTTVGTLSETTAGANIATTGSKVVQISANSMTLSETTSAATTVTLNITGTAGTVTDNGPITGTSATINAPSATGADTINLNDLNGTPFTVTGGGQTGLALNINDSANAAPTTYTVSSTQVTTSLPQTINYSGLSAGTLTLTTGSGGELINVNATAAATTDREPPDNGINTFNITVPGSRRQHRHLQWWQSDRERRRHVQRDPLDDRLHHRQREPPAAPASPGDTLAVNTGGAGASVTPTQVERSRDQPITYATIETSTSIGGPIVVTGGNNLVLTPTGPTSGSYQLDSDPVVNFSGITSFTWNGRAWHRHDDDQQRGRHPVRPGHLHGQRRRGQHPDRRGRQLRQGGQHSNRGRGRDTAILRCALGELRADHLLQPVAGPRYHQRSPTTRSTPSAARTRSTSSTGPMSPAPRPMRSIAPPMTPSS